MTGSFASRLRLRAQPWPLAVLVLLLWGCQSSELPPWLQDQSTATPAATAPPSDVLRAPSPAQRRPVLAPKATRPPPPASPPAAPIPAPAAPVTGPAVEGTVAPETAARPAPAGTPGGAPPGDARPGADPRWPSFLPYLNRPPGAARPAEPEAAAVPPPRSDDIVRVALLVPLTGTNSPLGRAMLNAAQLALFAFADRRFELLAQDTRGTPSGAAAAAQAAIGDGARMILGPLLATSVSAVAPAARAANVPVVAFSSDRSVAGNGVYTMGFLPSAEVERIVRFARAKGILRYAVLAPDNAYGATVVDAFERAVTAAGAALARVQFYDPHAEDFSHAVRALADYDSRREALLIQRRELEGRDDEVSQRALKRLENLQTLGELPFDALLVADGGKRLQSVAALLPFYDIDPAKVRVLGTGQWDASDLGAEPALIGAWFAAPPPSARTDFVAEYRATYGEAPPRLATLAYDATALAAVLARAETGPDFSAAAITAPSGFWGRDGIFRFLPDGIAERGLAVLKMGPRGAVIISRAPETFQARIN